MRCLLPFGDEKLVRDALDAAERLDPAWTFGQCLLASAGGSDAMLATRIARTLDRVGAEAARALARGAGPRAVGVLEKLLAARDVA